jgi:hypothetical protein
MPRVLLAAIEKVVQSIEVLMINESPKGQMRSNFSTKLRLVVYLAFAIVVSGVLFVAGANWLLTLLFLPGYALTEWLSVKLFGSESPLNRLSTSEVGFSISRIVFGVFGALFFFVLALLAIYGPKAFFRLFEF